MVWANRIMNALSSVASDVPGPAVTEIEYGPRISQVLQHSGGSAGGLRG